MRHWERPGISIRAIINNVEVLVEKGFYVIESNQGNHSGYNRTWRTWNARFVTRREAQRKMAQVANDENGVGPTHRGYTRAKDNSAWVDGKTYAVVSATELVQAVQGTGTSLGALHCVHEIED